MEIVYEKHYITYKNKTYIIIKNIIIDKNYYFYDDHKPIFEHFKFYNELHKFITLREKKLKRILK
jgi:hypothetical protein